MDGTLVPDASPHCLVSTMAADNEIVDVAVKRTLCCVHGNSRPPSMPKGSDDSRGFRVGNNRGCDRRVEVRVALADGDGNGDGDSDREADCDRLRVYFQFPDDAADDHPAHPSLSRSNVGDRAFVQGADSMVRHAKCRARCETAAVSCQSNACACLLLVLCGCSSAWGSQLSMSSLH
jgi:hypothetical protein